MKTSDRAQWRSWLPGQRTWMSLGLFVLLIGGRTSRAENYSDATHPVKDVFFLDSHHGWIVARDNDRYFVLQTTDGGSSWSKFPIPKGAYKIFFPNPQIGWALVLDAIGEESAKTYLFRTRDGGQTWEPSQRTAIARCVPADCSLVTGLAFTDDQHGWMIGQQLGGDGEVWEALDGGKIVHKLDLSAVTGAVSGIYATRTGRIWIFGEAVILSSHDQGKSWKDELAASGILGKRAQLIVRSGQILESGVGWAVGDGGATGLILLTDNFGSRWHVALESTHITTFMDLDFWDDAHGCALGPSTSLFCTVDGGKSWSENPVLPKATGTQSVFFSKIVMLNSRRGWVLRNGGYLYQTVDGGGTWYEWDPLKCELPR